MIKDVYEKNCKFNITARLVTRDNLKLGTFLQPFLHRITGPNSEEL